MSFTILNSSSREEWLEQRKGYLTATDIASIRTGSEKAFRELWEKKRKGETFRGNRFTEWGNEREPHIGAHVQSVLGKSELMPNDQLYVKDGTKHAATPDMVSKDGSFSCQIKTVGLSRDWDDIAHLPLDYRAQVEWEMYVLGIDECLFVWEQRLDGDDGFIVGETKHGLVKSDPKLRARLLQIAADFEEYEPAEVEDGGDDFTVRALIQDLVETMEERSELMAQEKVLKERLEKIQSDLLQEIGEDPRRIGYPEGVLEVNAGRVSNRFDRKAFAAEYPDLESKFIVESVGKPTVSFKAVS